MAQPINPRQLTCLQAMWHEKMRRAGISGEESRDLRHQYVAAATNGRARTTKELSFADARRVLEMLAHELGQIPDQARARAAGTHGRRGYDDHAQSVLVGDQQFRLLAAVQAKLGWDEVRLDAFIRRQLGRDGAIRTMADFNRVLWPMKRMARAQQAASDTLVKS